MRTKPNASVEYHDMLYKSLDDEAADARRIARSKLTCSDCGSDFGMRGGWDRETVASIETWKCYDLVKYYTTFAWDDHELYLPCWQCNLGQVIPDDFTPLTPEQVTAWLGRECTCPDCERKGKDHD